MNPLKKKPRSSGFHPAPEKPDWLKIRLPFREKDSQVSLVRTSVEDGKLNTVCESASCPNLNHCWSRRTATYMLAGDICTRRCSYCDVAFGKPLHLDPEEPMRVAESAFALALKHVVITSVNRDDLPDGAALHYKQTVELIRERLPECKIELLVPDFKEKEGNLEIVYSSKPDIFNHNLETVERLFETVAPAKKYHRSLRVLEHAFKRGFLTKSGLILGLGETLEEVREALTDLRNVGVQMVTLGQYLQPTPSHIPVHEYIHPDKFRELKEFGKTIGFQSVFAGPLVRSSYHADEQAPWHGN